MTIDNDLWDIMSSSSSRKPNKQSGSSIFNVNLPKKRPKSKIHIHGLNNESEDFLDLIGRSTKKKRIEDEIQIELNKKKDRPPLGKKIDLMSMSSLLSSQESQSKSQREPLTLNRATSHTNDGVKSDKVQSENEEEIAGEDDNEDDIQMKIVTEDRRSKDALGISSDNAAVQLEAYPEQNSILGGILNYEKQVIPEESVNNTQENEEEEEEEEEVKETVHQRDADGDYNEADDIEDLPVSTNSLSPDLIDDSEDEPDIIIPSTEVMEQLSSQIRRSHDEVPNQTHDDFDHSVPATSVIQGAQKEAPNSTKYKQIDLVPAISKESTAKNISPDFDTETSERQSKGTSSIKVTKVTIPKKAKVSLASLCSKTNNSQISHRVGLSKKFRVDSLHNYLTK
ncbi:hypothetical protein CLIB1423_06S03334 [[Candida] railenensis]|uniref:Uncharacterized protein n=1 Tax=[Candida] railenensis TaxID=45579 RepID=A0A9P0QPM8_9ASCO|nr:hypothetical protein CLIB1423_06S03334 [[Candida] railenensis]